MLDYSYMTGMFKQTMNHILTWYDKDRLCGFSYGRFRAILLQNRSKRIVCSRSYRFKTCMHEFYGFKYYKGMGHRSEILNEHDFDCELLLKVKKKH